MKIKNGVSLLQPISDNSTGTVPHILGFRKAVNFKSCLFVFSIIQMLYKELVINKYDV
jgi:hypothetical protein